MKGAQEWRLMAVLACRKQLLDGDTVLPFMSISKVMTSLLLAVWSGDCHEGCDLQVRAAQPIDIAPRERGALFSSPANALHRVTPITRGVRRGLVI